MKYSLKLIGFSAIANTGPFGKSFCSTFSTILKLALSAFTRSYGLVTLIFIEFWRVWTSKTLKWNSTCFLRRGKIILDHNKTIGSEPRSKSIQQRIRHRSSGHHWNQKVSKLSTGSSIGLFTITVRSIRPSLAWQLLDLYQYCGLIHLSMSGTMQAIFSVSDTN